MFRRRTSGRASSNRYVVVGLGNPGPAYAHTRHNVGAMFVERLAGELGATLKRTKSQMRVAEAAIDDTPVALGIPTTYMNESGTPVARLVRKQGVKPEHLVVVQDELDLPLGRIRIKQGGGNAGHRGLDSITTSLRSKDFVRIRMGIGRPEVGDDATDKVLSKFRPEEREVIDEELERAIDGLRVFFKSGLEAAQNVLNAPGTR